MFTVKVLMVYFASWMLEVPKKQKLRLPSSHTSPSRKYCFGLKLVWPATLDIWFKSSQVGYSGTLLTASQDKTSHGMGEALSLDRLLLMTTTSWNTALFRSSMFSPSLAAALMLCAYTYLRVTKKRLRVPLPPGPPKTVPFLGSLVHLPRHNAWEVYKRWGKEYSKPMMRA